MELEDRSEEATTPFEGIQDAQARPSEWIGFRKTGRIINLSYDKIAAILHSQVPRQHGFRPDFVVGIARGGILPASIVASNLRVPLYLIQVTRGSAPVSWTYAPGEVASSSARRPRALLVDDIASSGQTLLKAKGFLESAGMIVCTNTVFYDQRTALRPDIGSLALDYVRFPWERRENTPGSMQKKRAGSADAFHFLDEEDFFGFDLDGVFLDDVPAETYARQLEAALSMRDALQLLESSPRIALSMRKRAAIVTGRPQMDYDRTRQWLDRYGMHDIAL